MPTPVILIVFVLLAASLGLTVVRLLRGPTLSDRVVALDLLGFVAMALIAANVLVSGRTIFLDVLFVAALILFFGTIAFSRYIEKRAK